MKPDSFGPIFCEAARTHKALSFFGTGQRIPEDLAPASRGLLIDLILRDQLGPGAPGGVNAAPPGVDGRECTLIR